MTAALNLLFPAAALAVLASVTITDIRRMIIPNRIVLPAAAAALAYNVAWGSGPWWEYPVAGLAAFAFLLLPAIIRPGAMGMGDVKLALFMGFLLGQYVAVALFLALIASALIGLGLIATRVRGRKDRIPFGPFLAAGSAVALLAGEQLLSAYIQSL